MISVQFAVAEIEATGERRSQGPLPPGADCLALVGPTVRSPKPPPSSPERRPDHNAKFATLVARAGTLFDTGLGRFGEMLGEAFAPTSDFL